MPARRAPLIARLSVAQASIRAATIWPSPVGRRPCFGPSPQEKRAGWRSPFSLSWRPPTCLLCFGFSAQRPVSGAARLDRRVCPSLITVRPAFRGVARAMVRAGGSTCASILNRRAPAQSEHLSMTTSLNVSIANSNAAVPWMMPCCDSGKDKAFHRDVLVEIIGRHWWTNSTTCLTSSLVSHFTTT